MPTTKRTIEVLIPETAEVSRAALSMVEFAKAVGIGRTMVYHLKRQGLLRTFKVGSRTLVPMSEVTDFPARMVAKDSRRPEGV